MKSDGYVVVVFISVQALPATFHWNRYEISKKNDNNDNNYKKKLQNKNPFSFVTSLEFIMIFENVQWCEIVK